MAITHAPGTRDAMANAVVSRIDTGSALPSGLLQLSVDSGFSDIIVSLPLANPAFTPASGGSAAAGLNVGGGVSATYVGATKVANYFRFVDRDGNEVFRGTVSNPSGNGDMKLADNVITSGTLISVLSFIYTNIP